MDWAWGQHRHPPQARASGHHADAGAAVANSARTGPVVPAQVLVGLRDTYQGRDGKRKMEAPPPRPTAGETEGANGDGTSVDPNTDRCTRRKASFNIRELFRMAMPMVLVHCWAVSSLYALAPPTFSPHAAQIPISLVTASLPHPPPPPTHTPKPHPSLFWLESLSMFLLQSSRNSARTYMCAVLRRGGGQERR